ncbi:hypothetical protein, partial [Yersinia pestis]|uniref:hypothetical protein n=1 Tax=Yersinia pestis TaxID=632 RepID=UPI001EE72E8C
SQNPPRRHYYHRVLTSFIYRFAAVNRFLPLFCSDIDPEPLAMQLSCQDEVDHWDPFSKRATLVPYKKLI